MVVKSNGNTREAIVISRAKDLFFSLLKSGLENNRIFLNILESYYFVDIPHDKISELKSDFFESKDLYLPEKMNLDFGADPTTTLEVKPTNTLESTSMLNAFSFPTEIPNIKTQIEDKIPSQLDLTEEITMLEALFPSEFVVMPLKKDHGMTIQTGTIILDKNLFSHTSQKVQIVATMFTIMHEMAHLKRLKKFSKNNPRMRLRTPEGTKKHLIMIETGTTGTLLEKRAFGRKIQIEDIHEFMGKCNSVDDYRSGR